ncbi:hypothetical protein OZ405_002206 [Vibrio parahaemolyticus]|nr:hypothetical protein [Vibrio parahaemolyticus]ELA8200056.1 hypothetical protein [Vibrio parahaemolyticus]ELI5390264.1 hypothetical protein [Vibrio parahaemolyticus]
MKNTLISAVTTAVLLTGCSGLQLDLAKHGERVDLDKYQSDVERYIKVGLKDPDSLKNVELFQRPCVLTNYYRNLIEGSESWCIVATYQAKNSYGGYVRGSSTYYIDNDSLVGTTYSQHVLSSSLGYVEFPSDDPSVRL